MAKKYTIVWQKWQDDFFDEDSIETNDDSETDDYEDEDEDGVEKKSRSIISKKKSVLITPIGILPYNEASACNKSFNLWVAHTNFTITKTIADMIEGFDGVETLDVFTRYRFRVAIGQAFSDSEIMRDINKKLYNYLYESY